jgi:hypothetical protein
VFYPDFIFPPVNLWALPKQQRDYEMRNVKQDSRARSLKLNPRPRPKKASQPIIEPAKGEIHGYEIARAMHCKLFGARSRN